MKRAQIPGNNPLGCFLIAVVIWCAAGPSASAEDFVRVRADQIKPLMSGMAIETPSRNNNTLTYTFRPDGRLDGEVDHGAADEGKWWTTAEGLLCRQWESWGGGDRNCVVLSLGDNSIELLRSDGTPIHRIWEITNKGPRTAQIIAGRRTAGSRQQTADAQPAASPTPAADANRGSGSLPPLALSPRARCGMPPRRRTRAGSC